MDQEFKYIPTALIDPPQQAVRMDPASTNIEELAASIKEVGLLQPITVIETNGRYETLCGDRRQRACKSLGMEEIPCIVVKDPSTLAQVIRLTENVQRKDMSPIEEAANLQELSELQGWGYKLLAAHFGKSTQWVRDRINLLELPPDIQIMVHNKQLGINHGLILGKIADETTRKQYAQEAASNGIGIRTLEHWVELYEYSRNMPGGGDPDPSQMDLTPQPPRHQIRCQLCDEFKEVPQLMSLIACRDCVKILMEAKHVVPNVDGRTDHSRDADNPGMGDQSGEASSQN